jgi:WhiB family redox-sensing transcriptional regulator
MSTFGVGKVPNLPLAACKDYPVDLWFKKPGEGARDPYKDAKEVCASCPERVACLDFAMENNEKSGVWGGKTPDERRKLRSARHRRRLAARRAQEARRT